MKKREISRLEKIATQLELIDDINKVIKSCEELDSKLEVRQYEHLKKKLTKNLMKMLMEDYQITFPSLKVA